MRARRCSLPSIGYLAAAVVVASWAPLCGGVAAAAGEARAGGPAGAGGQAEAGRSAEKPEKEAEPLPAGRPVSGFVSTLADEANYRTYTFEVGADIVALRLELKAQADLDLYLGEKPIEDYKTDPIAFSAESTGTERLALDRACVPPLRTGRYYVDVAFGRDKPPRLASGARIAAIPYTLKLALIRTRVDGSLEPGKSVRGELTMESGSFRTYTIDVPADARSLRIDLTDAPANLDLRLRSEKPIVDPEEAEATAKAPTGTEAIVLKRDGDPPLRQGRYYVDVVDSSGIEWPVPFVLRASFAPEPAPELLALPRPPEPRSPLERALLSTVELLDEEGGGSGVLISERGYLLTNYHVVQGKVEGKNQVGEPVVVALTIDPRDPAREAFRATVVFWDETQDLALLRIVSGLYGQPIPADYRFPTAALGDPDRLGVGDPLFVVGYPDVGGSGSRVSVTFTRGVVAGFERRGASVHVKTDAMINAGNSGGAATDERFEVVGLPTETISDEDGHGQIGYIRPLSLVPQAWWETAGVKRSPARAPR